MPYGRCIGTWAREGGIALIPGPGRRGTRQVQARPGRARRPSRSCVLHYKEMSENHGCLILFHDFSQETYLYSERTGGSKVSLFWNLYQYADTMGGQK